MKVGWISAPLTASTGYARVAKEVCYRLADMGHEIVNIGGRGASVVWGEHFYAHTPKGNCVPVVPVWGQTGDHSSIEYYIRKFNLEAVISLFDAFVLTFGKPSKPWAAYFPIDTEMTKKWAQYLVNADYVVAYCRFGEGELLKYFPDFMVRMIPHGVDTETFHPRSEEERIELRRKWNIPEDEFVFLFVGANYGERKAPCQMILTFKRFLRKYDAILYMLTTMRGSYPNSYDFMEFAEEHGIAHRVMAPARNLTLDPIEDEELSELYALSDVLLLPSWGEGFGLPIIESMSCGTPVISTNSSSITELVEGHGWLIDTVPEDVWVDVPVWLPLLAKYPVPNLNSLLQCMEDAYENPDKLKAYGKTSREFALNFSWPKIIPLWDKLIKEMEGGA